MPTPTDTHRLGVRPAKYVFRVNHGVRFESSCLRLLISHGAGHTGVPDATNNGRQLDTVFVGLQCLVDGLNRAPILLKDTRSYTISAGNRKPGIESGQKVHWGITFVRISVSRWASVADVARFLAERFPRIGHAIVYHRLRSSTDRRHHPILRGIRGHAHGPVPDCRSTIRYRSKTSSAT